MIRHIFAAMAMACFTFLAFSVYAEELNDSAFHLSLSKSYQQTTFGVKFDKEGKYIGSDVQVCQAKFQPCFSSSDCCGYMSCKQHDGAGMVCH